MHSAKSFESQQILRKRKDRKWGYKSFTDAIKKMNEVKALEMKDDSDNYWIKKRIGRAYQPVKNNILGNLYDPQPEEEFKKMKKEIEILK